MLDVREASAVENFLNRTLPNVDEVDEGMVESIKNALTRGLKYRENNLRGKVDEALKDWRFRKEKKRVPQCDFTLSQRGLIKLFEKYAPAGDAVMVEAHDALQKIESEKQEYSTKRGEMRAWAWNELMKFRGTIEGSEGLKLLNSGSPQADRLNPIIAWFLFTILKHAVVSYKEYSESFLPFNGMEQECMRAELLKGSAFPNRISEEDYLGNVRGAKEYNPNDAQQIRANLDTTWKIAMDEMEMNRHMEQQRVNEALGRIEAGKLN